MILADESTKCGVGVGARAESPACSAVPGGLGDRNRRPCNAEQGHHVDSNIVVG